MRSIIALLFVVSLLLLPCAGCAGKEDPREREDFVDTTDPDAVMQSMESEPTEGQSSPSP
jgi:hypothetical protein